MFDNPDFTKLVRKGNSTGEVVAADRFLVTLRGLGDVTQGATVLFENGERGLVRSISPEDAKIFNLTSERIPMGTLAVVESDKMVTRVGQGLIGRVINVLGEPLDGQGPVPTADTRPVFAEAPGITDRVLLDQRLDTGVAIVDSLFPIALGQRMAILGDNKSGKTTFLSQMTLAQKETGRIVIYVLIAKRKVDVDRLLELLRQTGAINHTIVVVASVFDSLAQSYLAPYVGCAIGEDLWYGGRDTVIIYDDLSNHAKVYRELSLLGAVNPGRDSYPGDMFYAHSSLLERAGKLKSNGATLTAFPVILTPNEDITAYLPTNAMSITDGQIIFDLDAFRAGIRPAVNVGLSVARVGGRVQTPRQNQLTAELFRRLGDYRQAAEFSHFSSELALQSQANLALGEAIYAAFKQLPEETLTIVEQELLLGAVIRSEGRGVLDIPALKNKAKQLAPQVKDDGDYDRLIEEMVGVAA
jgi:F-type H+-transporting ATPase subunit alpha